MMERTVHITKRLQVPIPGSVYARAVCLGDVDNNGSYECVVGCLSGHLSIFRHLESTAWKTCSGLGTITCVSVAEIHNTRLNSVLCLNAEGDCYVFDLPNISATPTSTEPTSAMRTHSHHTGNSPSDHSPDLQPRDHGDSPSPSESCGIELTGGPSQHTVQPTYTYAVVTNASCVAVGDIDNDGLNELVVGTTDRLIVSYRVEGTALQKLNRWEMRGQITTIDVTTGADGRAFIVIGQQGYGYAVIEGGQRVRYVPLDTLGNEDSLEDLLSAEHISYDILGNIHFNGHTPQKTFLGVGSSDGKLRLVHKEKCVWTTIMPGVFSIAKIALPSDNSPSTDNHTSHTTHHNSSVRDTPDCVVGVAIDGTTYIANAYHTAVFDYQQTVAAFAAGKYTARPGGPPNATLVYVGFESFVHIYYDLGMVSLSVPSLVDIVQPELKKLQEELGLQLSERDVRELLRLSLYDVDDVDMPQTADDHLLQTLAQRGLMGLIS